MKIKHKFSAVVFMAIFFCCCRFVPAQGFKGIIPLESTCEDVKRILQVETCRLPISTYYLDDYVITVFYTKDKPSAKAATCFKVPAGRVSSLTVSYKKPFPIKDFVYALKFSQTVLSDIETTTYENSEKGILAYVDNGLISTALFGASLKQYQELAYKCKSDNLW
jgi:hypothetical protein